LAPLDAISEIRPLERAGENLRRRTEESVDDLGAGRRRRGHGHCDDLACADRVGRFAQLSVFRTEIVSPMRNAMRFIDGHDLRVRGAQGGDHCNGPEFRVAEALAENCSRLQQPRHAALPHD
jgi:hypothetical protein